MKRTIVITEQQLKNLQNKENVSKLGNSSSTFSIDTLKSTDWKHGEEIIQYCEDCNLICLGQGISRKVFQIDDERVIKVEKNVRHTDNQNTRELEAFQDCNDEMKQFIPYIYDWDKTGSGPLWIIAEQVLPATYADFQKILGINFGSYTSPSDIEKMRQDIEDYSKYDGKTCNKYGFNLMDFLEAYDEGDISIYESYIQKSKWLQELLKLLNYGIVNSWELENIENWGLVMRNQEPKLIILDIGI